MLTINRDTMHVVYEPGYEDLAAALCAVEGFAFALSGAGFQERYRTADGHWERRVVYVTQNRAKERKMRREREKAAERAEVGE